MASYAGGAMASSKRKPEEARDSDGDHEVGSNVDGLSRGTFHLQVASADDAIEFINRFRDATSFSVVAVRSSSGKRQKSVAVEQQPVPVIKQEVDSRPASTASFTPAPSQVTILSPPRPVEPCGSCGGGGHQAIDCVDPDADGFLGACPLCNTKSHEFYEDCPLRTNSLEQDGKCLLWRRQRKCQVKSKLRLDVLLAALVQAGHPHFTSPNGKFYLPHSPGFASDIYQKEVRSTIDHYRHRAWAYLQLPEDKLWQRSENLLKDEAREFDTMENALKILARCHWPDVLSQLKLRNEAADGVSAT
ncbi:hypothetical protein JX265_006141 [Neoarthrinium moseri]|uniref:Uncharacterized protein n=1 Tax=Neoarthrinium moseri TaxID=1658444 RepID=A0A9P9WMK1_9PEZI|nr:hypothetical protein JX265_006141 [Neoarthrinium moseri]